MRNGCRDVGRWGGRAGLVCVNGREGANETAAMRGKERFNRQTHDTTPTFTCPHFLASTENQLHGLELMHATNGRHQDRTRTGRAKHSIHL
jgi:hypothetical protein